MFCFYNSFFPLKFFLFDTYSDATTMTWNMQLFILAQHKNFNFFPTILLFRLAKIRLKNMEIQTHAMISANF